MVSVLRIINSIILKYQTDQTKQIGQEFLAAYRPSVVGILKRYAGVGGAEFAEAIDLSDLVDNLTLLISATGYLEVSFLGLRFTHLTCLGGRSKLCDEKAKSIGKVLIDMY
jgi:hypothetical protein